MNVNVIKFPIICIARDETISLEKNSERLSICSIDAFNSGYFNDLLIYDHLGKIYQVSKSTLVHRLPFYWGWKNFFHIPMMVKAILEIEEKGFYSIEELRLKIIKSFENDDWIKGIDENESKEFMRLLKNAKDFDDLFSTLKLVYSVD